MPCGAAWSISRTSEPRTNCRWPPRPGGAYSRGVHGRCHLVYAVAPEGVPARKANELLNEYVADGRRGIAVFHDHFVGVPHGGVIVLDVRTEEEQTLLGDPGPLAGWELRVHALTFSLTAVGFEAQTELTLEGYRGLSMAGLRVAEEDDPRFWWRRDG
jgi:hypothetical protein